MVQKMTISNKHLVSLPTRLIHCAVDELESYEVQIIPLETFGKGGVAKRLRVRRSLDGGVSWDEIPMKLTLKSWWNCIYNYVGGDRWPPCGEDVEAASIKNGRLTIRYSQAYLFSADGKVTIWEAQYWPSVNRWTIQFLEKF